MSVKSNASTLIGAPSVNDDNNAQFSIGSVWRALKMRRPSGPSPAHLSDRIRRDGGLDEFEAEREKALRAPLIK